MKKHLSVLMLFARSSIWKLLAVFLAMAATEGALFYAAMGRVPLSLEGAFAASGIRWVCAAGFVLVTYFLCRTGGEHGSREGYTLRRLSVSEKSVFVWQAVYNSLCFFLFWAAQLFIALALCRLFYTVSGAEESGQTVLLAFYRDDFLHSLLPLRETSRLVRNVLLAACLGFASASNPARRRHGQSGFAIAVLAALTIVLFPRGMGAPESDVLLGLIALCVAAEAAVSAFERELADEN